jgi:Transposase DDE domain
MFIDPTRSTIHDQVWRQEHRLFDHILTPGLLMQAALMCGLRVVCSPLNLFNLVRLALSAARHPGLSFADLLERPLKGLRDDERFAGSGLDQSIHQANRRRGKHGPPKAGHAHRKGCSRRGCHSPHAGAAEAVSAQAFAEARRRMPTEFWVALFVLLGQRFEALYPHDVRWGAFRLLALDGTGLPLPDYPALRDHFGTARNGKGSHDAQARLVLLLLPLARFPLAYALRPYKVGESTMARQLLRGLRPGDLVLLDAGFRSYGVLAQIAEQGASFCLRLSQKLNLKVVKRLGSNDDVEVVWRPKDSRGQWAKEGLPKSLRLRRLTYRRKGFRPFRLLTNVLSAEAVPYERWWGLSVSEEGEVLARGIYNFRWEIETTYRELKEEQGLEGGLRSRTPEGVEYEVAGHVLYYLLMRWLILEAAVAAKVSPLRLSFQGALRECQAMTPAAVLASAGWVEQTLRPRLVARLATHVVRERPGRSYPRAVKERRARKRANTAKFRRQQKARAKARRDRPARPRPWFGDGWDLRGRKNDLDPPDQG